MSERSNSCEHLTKALRHSKEVKKKSVKMSVLKSRAEEELGDNPTEQQLAEFRAKYQGIITSLGEKADGIFK